MTTATLSGIDLHYRIEGPEDAPVVLFSNSLGTNLHMWDPVVERLRDQWRCVRYDTRGHGQSSVSNRPYTLEMLTDDVLSLIDHLGLERIHFCGLSLGGLTGQQLALTAQSRLKSLILANTSAHIPPAEAWNTRIETVSKDGMAVLGDIMMSRWFSASFPEKTPQPLATMKAMFESCDPLGYAGACAAVRDADLRARLSDITLPTLIIAGADDVATPPEMSIALQDGISGSRLVTLGAAGHISSFEQPDAFAKALTDFVDHVEKDPR